MKQEYIWFRGGDLNDFEIFVNFLNIFQNIWAIPVGRGQDHPLWSSPTYYLMILESRLRGAVVRASGALI
jgi:hypothetical protein